MDAGLGDSCTMIVCKPPIPAFVHNTSDEFLAVFANSKQKKTSDKNQKRRISEVVFGSELTQTQRSHVVERVARDAILTL